MTRSSWLDLLSTVWDLMRFPRPSRLSRTSPVVLLAVLAGLLGGLVAPATAGAPARSGDQLTVEQVLQIVLPQLGFSRGHSTQAAAAALKNAQQVLGDKKPHAAQQPHHDENDATMALTSLFQHREDLSTSDRSVAARMLARPDDSSAADPVKWNSSERSHRKSICNDAQKVCVHYTTAGDDKSTDAWAKKTLGVVAHVRKTYKSAGYRSPVGDGTKGGKKNYTDIYLADVAPYGYYGFCAPESGRYVATAFCVLDNDYAASQYGKRHTPTENLEVTAAHEFFHAVQFAYDVNEDLWLMEGTAVWAEDQLYTKVNDNRQYLKYGQLRRPRVPLDDTNGAYGFGVYGNWIFFRYLSEHMPKKKGPLPSIILQIWQKAAVSANRKHNKYSVQAIASALVARGRNIKGTYAKFTVANLHPRISYREGRSTKYPNARVQGVKTLKPKKKKASGSFKVGHLSSATQRFKPHNLGKKWQLRLTTHMAKKKFGVAIVTVYRKHKTITRTLKLNRAGNGHTRVDFDNAHIIKVEITLVNTAHGYKCHKGTAYACAGQPTTGSLKDSWTAKLVRR